MTIRTAALFTVLSAFCTAAAAQVATPVETPLFAEDVAAGKLSPVAARLPQNPRVVRLKNPGRHGGTMRVVFGRSKDTRIMVVYGYARLMTYDAQFQLQPDILAGVDVEQGRVFTLRLRKGHRWSDGTPFTSEDFRYWWEDIANHKKLSPLGAPKQMVIAGELATFEVIDNHTVRFS